MKSNLIALLAASLLASPVAQSKSRGPRGAVRHSKQEKQADLRDGMSKMARNYAKRYASARMQSARQQRRDGLMTLTIRNGVPS